MTDFIKGKLKKETSLTLFKAQEHRTKPLTFSDEGTAVFEAGRELWKYYHAAISLLIGEGRGVAVNASLYDR